MVTIHEIWMAGFDYVYCPSFDGSLVMETMEQMRERWERERQARQAKWEEEDRQQARVGLLIAIFFGLLITGACGVGAYVAITIANAIGSAL